MNQREILYVSRETSAYKGSCLERVFPKKHLFIRFGCYWGISPSSRGWWWTYSETVFPLSLCLLWFIMWSFKVYHKVYLPKQMPQLHLENLGNICFNANQPFLNAEPFCSICYLHWPNTRQWLSFNSIGRRQCDIEENKTGERLLEWSNHKNIKAPIPLHTERIDDGWPYKTTFIVVCKPNKKMKNNRKI